MLTKVGNKAYEGLPYPSTHPRLGLLERSLMKCALIGKDDKVLDVGLGDGQMIDYLRRNMECEVCGVSDNMELVRRTRGMVHGADLVYAGVGDIPWRDEAFDTVLLRPRDGSEENLEKQLREIQRVMKDGGQLAIGVRCCPRALRPALRLFSDEEYEGGNLLSRREIEALLTKLEFEHLSWQRASLGCGVAVCWKKKPAVDHFFAQAEP